jgi:hypothetical protein
MLFHKQIKAGIEFAHVKPPHDIGYTTEFTSDFSVGLFNKCQLVAVWYYFYGNRKWDRFDHGEMYSIMTYGSLKLAYRSYKYNPGQGPGWNQDSKYDIVFGAIPEFGQFYITVTYILPKFYKEADNLGFLTLTGLGSNRRSYLDTDLIFGLGRNFILKARDKVEFHNSAMLFRYFEILLETRILDRFVISAEYSQRYCSHCYFAGFDDPEIKLTIQGLL